MSAAVCANPDFTVQGRTDLFRGNFSGNQFHAGYDVTADGLFVMTQGQQASNDLIFVLNWFDQLRARRSAGTTGPAAAE